MKTTWRAFLVLLLLAAPAGVQGQYTWITNVDNTFTITGYSGPPWDVNIPTNINNHTVTGIGSSAFENLSNLTSVTIPGIITAIGADAFDNCVSLTNATISDGVTNIGADAFDFCTNLTSVTIPASVTTIGDGAFEDCSNLTSVYFEGQAPALESSVFNADGFVTVYFQPDPSGLNFTYNQNGVTVTSYSGSGGAVNIPTSFDGLTVTGIGPSAFFQSYTLTNVTIPASVTNIAVAPFAVCTNLTEITVAAGNPVYSSVSNVLFGTNPTTLIQYPGGIAGSYVIPDGVRKIGNGAFEYCTGLTGVTIPGSVTDIGDSAFFECVNLTAAAIPDGVTTIEDDAFGVCLKLASVTIPESVTSLGWLAFFDCGLTSVTIPTNVTSITGGAFEACFNMTAITVVAGNPAYRSVNGVLFDQSLGTLIEFPDGVTGSYVIPGSVTNIGGNAFASCSLTSVTIPTNVTSIGGNAFNGSVNLTSLSLPESITSIEAETFAQCYSLTSVTIPDSISNIAFGAFQACLKLTNVIIAGSVTEVGSYALGGCPKLTSVYFEGNAPGADSTLFVADSDVTSYYLQGTTGWGSTLGGFPTLPLTAISITANPTNGEAPVPVNFTSAGVDGAGHAISNWNWTFGDGSTSAVQNPSHNYAIAGAFSVAVIETNNGGVPIAGAGTTITLSPPTVAFTANPTNGARPLTVSFTSAGVDSAGNAITGWNWSFGDGAFNEVQSELQNPSHVYTRGGAYSPKLAAINSLGGAVIGVGPASITVTNAPPVYSGLVLNGGFETGDFTDWTLSGDTNNSFVDDGSQTGITPNSGSYSAALETSGSLGYLSQTLSTIAGRSYLLSFWFENPYGDPGELLVSWNGNALLDTTNLGDYEWTNMQFAVTAAGPGTVLQFGLEDDYDYLGLDDISVALVQPAIAGFGLSGSNLSLKAINGQSGGTYYVLMTTNLALPLSQWTRVATNVLSAGGDFSITVTNTVTGAVQQRMYILETQ